MNHKEYIDSGVLHDYCLGLLSQGEAKEVERLCKLHSELKQELELMQAGLEKLAERDHVKPRGGLKNEIWKTLQNLNKEKSLDIKNLPVITTYSDSKKWLEMLAPLLPEKLEQEEFTLLLQNTGKIMQKAYKTRKSYGDEVHEDVLEGIFVLEGKCTCKIGDEYIDYVAGDLIQIPLHVVHNLTVTSPTITFVVQHLAA